MSGDSINYGDTVNMYGGTGNTGMVKNSAPAAALDPQLRSAIEALIEQLRELREQVPPLTARTIDESLPVLAPDAAVPVQARTRALMAVAGVAATAGALGVPIVEAVNAILQLLA
ncbi:hypothetical protein [Streptomyces sp. NPDC006610]|uniref:hypothetical protein n=1 Tax=Streptomyces sp. NPDC006610 TaxID=3154584 RepID=UPI0033BA9222